MTTMLTRLSMALGAALLALASSLPAQDLRELTDEVAEKIRFNVTSSTINSEVANGWRLVDLEFVTLNGFGTPIFDASFVQNTGNYQGGYWWYYGLTASTLSNHLSTNQGRLIDVEPYQTSSGLRFACIMVPNTGSNAKTWWWYYGSSVNYLSSQAASNNARIVDLQPYTWNGTTYYAAIMIRNNGADYRPWWWYVNVTPAQLNIYLNSNNARLYDLERRTNGNYDCVMTRQTPTPNWYYWYGLTATQVADKMANYGVRAVDIEGYPSGSSRRYAVVAVNNSNELETDVGNTMRSATDGTIGFLLADIDGTLPLVFAEQNGIRPFEPASTIKVLPHVHAMRRVYFNNVTLSTPLTVYNSYSPAGSSCPGSSNPASEPLSSVLSDMMENSDNARTKAVIDYFGQSNINFTGSGVGMNNTLISHTLGCAGPALTSPNWTTLWDLMDLHMSVVGGFLGPQRETFYNLMRDDTSDLNFDTLCYTQGQALGLPNTTIQHFISQCRLAHKGGSYDLIPSGSSAYYHRSEFGYLRLPFIYGGQLTPREFAFGAFVNDASSDTAADTAIWTNGLPTLLRGMINSALSTWTGHIAGTATIGAGCGSPTYIHNTNLPPRLDSTVSYRGILGLPNALSLLAFGFSDTSWNGLSLPLDLQPFGSSPGCYAYNDWATTLAFTTNGAGFSNYGLVIPADFNLLGYQFYSQWFSLNGATSISSNGLKSTVGL